MERMRAYSKRFAALATGFAHKYRVDPFVRTEANIVALQVVFALLILLVVGVGATSLYHDASNALERGIAELTTDPSSIQAIGTSVVDELSEMRIRTVTATIVGVVGISFVLSFLIARVALTPTRNALESQKQFIGNVAHELRTPLSIIKTNTEVGLMSSVVEPELKKILVSTVGELDRISEILNNLLSLSASVRPERMEFMDVDMGEVLNNAMGSLKDLADSKHVEIIARMSERRIVWGNTTALEQIAMNILKNAITFTPRGGRVVTTLEPVYTDYVEMRVQDFGVGIARKDLFRIFEPYYRVDPSRKRRDGGSGLGLTIVSELVKLHGGKVTVRSAEKRGTIVTVLLPAGRRTFHPEGGAARKDEESGNEITVDFSRTSR